MTNANEPYQEKPSVREDGWVDEWTTDDYPTKERAARNGSASEIWLLWTPAIGTKETERLLEEMGLT